MNSSFIPALHFIDPADKLKPPFAEAVINYYYFNAANRHLLERKRIEEIERYAVGDIPMDGFKRLYKSIKKRMEQNGGTAGQSPAVPIDDTDMQFNPLPLIPTPFNSAVSVIQKVPIDIACTALDPLAAAKKKQDVTFLKNKPGVEADLQSITNQMGLSKIDLGATQHSAIPFSDSPYGLNLNEPDEYDVFVNLLYKLGVETCFETALQIWCEVKNIYQVRLLETKDQFKFGVSCNRAYESTMTGLPECEYVYPANLFTPPSDLQDYGDNTHRYQVIPVTPMELFNYFGNEICDENTLENIVLGANKYGYCSCNGITGMTTKNFDTFKMSLVYFEVKSIDWVGKVSNPKSKKDFTFFADDNSKENCTSKIWGQNTYGFYWLRFTKHFFGIHRLGYSHRTMGTESYQNFSTNIYKSQEKSAVENSIGENKKAQIADIKMQYAIIMSGPAGKYIDLKFLRGAVEGLSDDNNAKTIDNLIDMALERNIFIGDSTGFDEVNGGQYKPYMDIPGGLKAELQGYMQVIQSAQLNIASFTGINQQLTGQSEDTTTLIGLEKLRISASLNSLNYATAGIESQYQKVLNQWAYSIKQAIKKGGKTKEAMVSIIGSRKVDILSRLDELPLHDIGVKITISQREEERQKFEDRVYKLEAQGVLSSADIYMLEYIPNIKDRFALLAVKEKQFMKRQDAQKQQDAQNQQALAQQQGQNMQQTVAAKSDGDIKKVYAKGQVDSQIAQLQGQLAAQAKQYDALVQQSLQRDRSQEQIQKAVQTLQAKSQLDQQAPLV